jgi:hypothetical protein
MLEASIYSFVQLSSKYYHARHLCKQAVPVGGKADPNGSTDHRAVVYGVV